MTPWYEVWSFSRERLAPAWTDLSDTQLTWRPHTGAHCVGELLLHIAGAEHYWWARMTGVDPSDDGYGGKLDRSVRAGFLVEGPFPFDESDITGSVVAAALDQTAEKLAPILKEPTQAQLTMQIESPLGPIIEGKGGLIRVAQHAAYHTGQIWLMRMDPSFPA